MFICVKLMAFDSLVFSVDTAWCDSCVDPNLSWAHAEALINVVCGEKQGGNDGCLKQTYKQ